MKGLGAPVLVLTLSCLVPAAAHAQAAAPATPGVPSVVSEPSRMVIVLGGTSTTLRGDCQEDCVAHGKGAYLHTGSVKGFVGYRVNRQLDGGAEVSWVPTTDKAGEDIRSTFILGTVQFRPLASRGLFLNGGMGMAFLRDFAFAGTDAPPVTSKALALTYGIGWTFRQSERLGFQIFGAQHMAAVGDFESGGITVENVVGNFWSVGAAIVIR